MIKMLRKMYKAGQNSSKDIAFSGKDIAILFEQILQRIQWMTVMKVHQNGWDLWKVNYSYY